MLRVGCVVAGLACVVSGSAAIAQEAVFSHEVVVDDAKVGLGAYSSSEPRPNKNYRRADDFVLAGDAGIGGVAWWGQSTADFAAGLANFKTFTVQFYGSLTTEGGELQPEVDPFASFTIAKADVGAELTGRLAPNGGREYRFSVDLPDEVALIGGTTYFFSVSAGYNDPSRDAFQWSDSEFDNGYGGSWSYERSRWEMLQDTDSAFVLYSGVPTPGGMGAMGLAMLMLSRRSR